MKIDITKPQLDAVVHLKDDIKAMIGCGDGDTDSIWEKKVELIERMLLKNGIAPKIYTNTNN